jgi:hypothetical protein
MTILYKYPYGIAIENKETTAWTEENAALMDQANIRHARLMMKWNHFQTDQDESSVDWPTLDAAMDLADAHHINVSWVLYSAPDFAIQPGTKGMWTGAGMADWAKRVYTRYGNRIKVFELGNEDPFFGETALGASGANYAQIALPVAQQLRSMGFAGPLVTAGYTNYNTVAQITAWFTDLHNDPSNLASMIDAYGLHFYHPGDPLIAYPQKPSLDQCISAINAVAVAAHHGGKPVWITETGQITHTDPYHTNAGHVVSEATQADNYQKILEYGRTSGGKLAHVDWYTMRSGAEGLSLTQQGKPLQAYTMLKSEIAQYPTWPHP